MTSHYIDYTKIFSNFICFFQAIQAVEKLQWNCVFWNQQSRPCLPKVNSSFLLILFKHQEISPVYVGTLISRRTSTGNYRWHVKYWGRAQSPLTLLALVIFSIPITFRVLVSLIIIAIIFTLHVFRCLRTKSGNDNSLRPRTGGLSNRRFFSLLLLVLFKFTSLNSSRN